MTAFTGIIKDHHQTSQTLHSHGTRSSWEKNADNIIIFPSHQPTQRKPTSTGNAPCFYLDGMGPSSMTTSPRVMTVRDSVFTETKTGNGHTWEVDCCENFKNNFLFSFHDSHQQLTSYSHTAKGECVVGHLPYYTCNYHKNNDTCNNLGTFGLCVFVLFCSLFSQGGATTITVTITLKFTVD